MVVYILYKDSNVEMAHWHLTVSIAGTIDLLLGLTILTQYKLSKKLHTWPI